LNLVSHPRGKMVAFSPALADWAFPPVAVCGPMTWNARLFCETRDVTANQAGRNDDHGGDDDDDG